MANACSFLGLDFNAIGEGEALCAVSQMARGNTFTYIVTPNVDHLVRLHDNQPSAQDLWPAYRGAALTICDSRILSRLAARTGLELPAVPGSDITASILNDPRFSECRVHVIGGTENMLGKLEECYPHIRWSQFIPPPRVLDDTAAQEAIVQSVIASQADIAFMAFGSPQSEMLCLRISESGKARGVGLCIGASLEFLTGDKRRAPRIMQVLGLEWFFRLMNEPARLWRRYLVEGPRIFVIWATKARRSPADM